MEETRTCRRRYLGFRIHSLVPLHRKGVEDLLNLMLEGHYPKATLITYYPEIAIGVLSCDYRTVNEVRELLNAKVQDITFTSLTTSGTLETLRKRILGHKTQKEL